MLGDPEIDDAPVGPRESLGDPPKTYVVVVDRAGLGRGVEHKDKPIVRAVARDAASQNYRFSSIVLGIVNSAPFQMKKAQTDAVGLSASH